MAGFTAPTAAEVESLARRLELPLDEAACRSAARRASALADVYAKLHAARVPADDAGASDPFAVEPHPPDDDPFNAWLSRFELSRSASTGPLAGRTVAIKDNTCVAGAPLTNGSRAFESLEARTHATVVDRLLEAGATLLGKTNMDELAFGPTSETSAFGPVENPRAAGHVAGGSSSGSAAAVAAGEVDLALGTDTGGSVRIPASYCGIVGLKPSYGTVPLHGVTPMARSLDHVGPLARDVETVAAGYAAMADRPVPTLTGDDGPVSIGVAERPFDAPVEPRVAETVRAAIADLEADGAEVVEVEIPSLEWSQPAWWGIAPAEFAATLVSGGAGLWADEAVAESITDGIRGLWDGAGDRLGGNVLDMLALGAHCLFERRGVDYAEAARLRRSLRQEYADALSAVDVLCSPSTPSPALEIGGFERGVTPPVNWCTHPTDLTGHPAISVPAGEVDGRPVGAQFVASMGAEPTLLSVAARYETLAG